MSNVAHGPLFPARNMKTAFLCTWDFVKIRPFYFYYVIILWRQIYQSCVVHRLIVNTFPLLKLCLCIVRGRNQKKISATFHQINREKLWTEKLTSSRKKSPERLLKGESCFCVFIKFQNWIDFYRNGVYNTCYYQTRAHIVFVICTFIKNTGQNSQIHCTNPD